MISTSVLTDGSGKFFLRWFAMLIRKKKTKPKTNSPKSLASVLKQQVGIAGQWLMAAGSLEEEGIVWVQLSSSQQWCLFSSGSAGSVGQEFVAPGDYIFKLISAWQFFVLYKWINQKCLVAFCTLLHAESRNKRILEY